MKRPGSFWAGPPTGPSEPPCQEVKLDRILASALFLLASGEHGALRWLSVLLCFVFQIVAITSVPYLSSSIGIVYKGPPNNSICLISTEMTKDKTPGIWPVYKPRSQRQCFQSEHQGSPRDLGPGTGNETGKNTALSRGAAETQM